MQLIWIILSAKKNKINPAKYCFHFNKLETPNWKKYIIIGGTYTPNLVTKVLLPRIEDKRVHVKLTKIQPPGIFLPVCISYWHWRRYGGIHGSVVEWLQSRRRRRRSWMIRRCRRTAPLISKFFFPSPFRPTVGKPHLYPSFRQADLGC